jgi:hypothetical protein
MPIAFLLAFFTPRVLNSPTPAFVALFSWMAFYVVAGIRFQVFKCPRCGKCFFLKWWFHNIFAGRCVHCGLPKYADTSTQR